MPNDSFFKNIQAVEKFLNTSNNSILNDEQTEENASEWVKKHSEYVKDKSINPLRFYAGVFHRDPRVLKMIPLAQKLEKKMKDFIDQYKNNINEIDKKELEKTTELCNTFLLEFGKACGYFGGDHENEKDLNIKKIIDELKKAKHQERYEWVKKFGKKLDILKEYNNSVSSKGSLNKFNETEKLKQEQAEPSEKHKPVEIFDKKLNTLKEYDQNHLENSKKTLNEFKEDVLPKIEALVIYKPPISENLKQSNITISHNVTDDSSSIKKLIKNNNKNSEAITLWKPPLKKQFEDLEQLKQCVVKNFPQIKKVFSDENSDSGTEIKQFIVKNFSEIKKAFPKDDDLAKIRRSKTFEGKHSSAINEPSNNDNTPVIDPTEKNISSDHVISQKNEQITKPDNNEKVNIIDEETINEKDKIAVEEMNLNTVQITYYRALVSLLHNKMNSKCCNKLQQKIKNSGLLNKAKGLDDFNTEINTLCKTDPNISIIDAIKKLKKDKDKNQKLSFDYVQKTYEHVQRTFSDIAKYIHEKTKQDDKDKIFNELWEKTNALINFNSGWKNESTKKFFDIKNRRLNADNIECLKILYYLRRIFEILDKCVKEYKNKKECKNK